MRAGWLYVAVAAGVAALPAGLAAQPVPPPWPPPGFVPQPLPPPPPVQPPVPWPVFLVWLPFLAVAAAAALKQQQDREEEEVNPVEPDGPVGYEYKIVRSATAVFRDRDQMRATLAEEARAGWELYEKLDCNRLRLRRPVSCRAKDAELEQDPYRTRVGAGEGKIIVWAALGILGGLCLVLLVVALLLKK